MIIVFSNDQTVSVLPDIDSVHRECEAVDVEDGAYRFFDDSGRHLLVHWTSFVERRSLFGGANQLEADVSNWSWILRMMVRVLKYRLLMSWPSLPTQRLRQSKIWLVTFLRIAVR